MALGMWQWLFVCWCHVSDRLDVDNCTVSKCECNIIHSSYRTDQMNKHPTNTFRIFQNIKISGSTNFM